MKNGPYSLIKAPAIYPGRKYRGRYAYEHTIVWWQHYGAVPATGLEIHHLNGNHRDNNIENLRVVTSEEHKRIHGQEKAKAGRVRVNCSGCGKELTILRKTLKWATKVRAGRIHCSRTCSAKNRATRTKKLGSTMKAVARTVNPVELVRFQPPQPNTKSRN